MPPAAPQSSLLLVVVPDDLLCHILSQLTLPHARIAKATSKRMRSLVRRVLTTGAAWEVARTVSAMAAVPEEVPAWYERSRQQFMLGLEQWPVVQAVALVASMHETHARVLQTFVSSLQHWASSRYHVAERLRELLQTGELVAAVESSVVCPLMQWEDIGEAAAFLLKLGGEAPVQRIVGSLETCPLGRITLLLSSINRLQPQSGQQFALEVCIGLWRWRVHMEKAGRVLASLPLPAATTVLAAAKLIYFFACVNGASDDASDVRASEMLRGWCLSQRPEIQAREVRNQLRQQASAVAVNDHARWIRSMTFAWKRRKVDPEFRWYTMRMHCEGFLDSAQSQAAGSSA